MHSLEDLGKLEHERAAARKCITRDRHSVVLKRGGSVDTGISGERPYPKEHRAERGRSHECRCVVSPECPPPPPFPLTPTAPSHPITSSLCAPSLSSNRGSLPLDRVVDTGVPASSTGPVTPTSSHQPVQPVDNFTNAQVDSGSHIQTHCSAV